jgi:glycosyltransferase involved in cell wall biosynthesis
MVSASKPTLVVTIPAYNEEETLKAVIASVPSKMDGIGKILVLVVDDGSTDLTPSIAREAGAHVISNPVNRGLAYTFSRALDGALELGADIIVNTDGDNQYDQGEIPALIRPILQKKADMVLGSRFKGKIEEMPFSKRIGNQFASWILKQNTGLEISDGQTGFRALTRDAAMRLNVLSKFTYTQETIIDAADKGLRVVEVPCTFRKREGKSRLFNGVFDYAGRALHTVVIGSLKLHPISTFGGAGIVLILGGLYIGWPVIQIFLVTGKIGEFFLMRAIVTGIMFIVGIEIAALGLIAALVKQNRQLLEKNLYETKKAKYGKGMVSK